MALEAPDVVGPGEARAIIGVSRPTFMRHKSRPDFPPAAHLECGDVYERRAIVAYGKQRETGKPYLRALELWREYRADPEILADAARGRAGALERIARDLELSKPTVRRYLQQLGEVQR